MIKHRCFIIAFFVYTCKRLPCQNICVMFFDGALANGFLQCAVYILSYFLPVFCLGHSYLYFCTDVHVKKITGPAFFKG